MITLENLTYEQVKAHIPQLIFKNRDVYLRLTANEEELRRVHGVEFGQVLALPNGVKVYLIGACQSYLWVKHPLNGPLIRLDMSKRRNQEITFTSEIVNLKTLLAVIIPISNYEEFILGLNLAPLSTNDYALSERSLGEGTSSCVYTGTVNHEPVACKKFKADSRGALREIQNLLFISENIPPNDFLIKFKGYALPNGTPPLIFTELMNDGNVHDFIIDDSKYELTQCLPIIECTALALALLHQAGVIHRDVKAENILLHQGKAKLCDFAFMITETEAKNFRGTAGTDLYLAPELMLRFLNLLMDGQIPDGYSKKSDIYALGVLIYELYFRKELYEDLPNIDDFFRAIGINKLIPTITVTEDSPKAQKTMASIYNRCCLYQPKQRIDANEIVALCQTSIQP